MTSASTDMSLSTTTTGPDRVTPAGASPEPAYLKSGQVQLTLLPDQKAWWIGSAAWSMSVPAPCLGATQTARATDLFLGSLGFCMGDLVMSYCQHKEFPVQGITITVRDHPADQPLRIAGISVDLVLDAALSATEREQISSIVERQCKIGNTLRPSVDIVVTVSNQQFPEPSANAVPTALAEPERASPEADGHPTIKCSC